MVQILPEDPTRGSAFGRIGKGFAKSLSEGLSEQIPKEAERYRLSQGLRDLSQKKDLSPFQRFSELSSIPGVTPEIIRSGTELLKQQNQANALGSEPRPFPVSRNKESPRSESNIPSLTSSEAFEKYQEGYIPPSQDEIIQDAARRYEENPGLYKNDPDLAIQAAQVAAERDRLINESYREKHKNLTEIQDNVVNRLRDHSSRLGVEIPANIFSKIEDMAIQATKPKSQGGRGLTEQQAMKEYGDKLDDISREYSAIDSLGNWGILSRPAKETLSNLRSLQDKFEERKDTENFADRMISRNQISPKLAYSIAQPVKKNENLNSEISKLPKLKGITSVSGGLISKRNLSKEDIYNKTLEASKKLLPHLGKNGSPLAVAYELENKGYDPHAWMSYLNENKNKLTTPQRRQLDKPNSITGTLNDWWLSSWSGLK